MTALIVGGDSFLGGALLLECRRRGVDALCTTRRPDTVGGKRLFLDAMRPDDFSIPAGVDAAVIAAAGTGYTQCRNNPELRRLNCECIPTLAARLIGRGIFTLLLSTSAVFAEDARYPGEGAACAPQTEYGRQKLICEQHTATLAGKEPCARFFGVVRLTRVVATEGEPLKSWMRSWRRGENANAFTDVRFSPISGQYAAAGIVAILERGISGCSHLSGREGMSFAEFCRRLATAAGIAPELALGTTSREAGVDVEFRPADGTLDMRKTGGRLGISPQNADDTIHDVLSSENGFGRIQA